MKKNQNKWSSLQDIKTPDGLKERTLAAARELRTQNGPCHLAPRERRFRMAKRILALACAFSVVIGGTALWQSRQTGQSSRDAVAEAITHSFGFVAYAADTGEMPSPQDSIVCFDNDSGCDDLEKGFYSGCLFKVKGENIKSISASIDKSCGFYRMKTFTIQQDDVGLIHGGTPSVPGMEGADQIMVSGTADENVKGSEKWWADTCWNLGSSFTEAYDPDASYGFWAPPAISDPEEDLREAWHARVDEFDGANLSVTVTFTDNTTQTQTMTLHSGKLVVEYRDNVSGPQLTGEVCDDTDTGTPYLYGVYGKINEQTGKFQHE